MKNLRKWIALAAAMAMTATLLTGCGSSEAPASEAAASTADSSTAVATAPAETTAADGELAADVQAIVDRGVLRVGVKNAVVGFGFQDTLTGEYSGLEISLAEKIAESLGVDVEFTAVTAATRTELLDSGDIDCVLATFTITDERKQSWVQPLLFSRLMKLPSSSWKHRAEAKFGQNRRLTQMPFMMKSLPLI